MIEQFCFLRWGGFFPHGIRCYLVTFLALALIVSCAAKDQVEAKKERVGEIMKELWAMEDIEKQKEAANNPQMQEKLNNLIKEGEKLMKELTGGDKSKEEALGMEIAKKYAPEFYEGIQKAKKTSQISDAKGQLYNIRTALEVYRVDRNVYPTTEEGLGVLIKKDDPKRLMDGEDALKDPWGNPIFYKYPSPADPHRYVLKSLGPDGKDGTPDDIDLETR